MFIMIGTGMHGIFWPQRLFKNCLKNVHSNNPKQKAKLVTLPLTRIFLRFSQYLDAFYPLYKLTVAVWLTMNSTLVQNEFKKRSF